MDTAARKRAFRSYRVRVATRRSFRNRRTFAQSRFGSDKARAKSSSSIPVGRGQDVWHSAAILNLATYGAAVVAFVGVSNVPLVLVARKTPLHCGHLRAMTAATEAGAVIMPPASAFYLQPKGVGDIVNHFAPRRRSTARVRSHSAQVAGLSA
jgi:Flavoprotein